MRIHWMRATCAAALAVLVSAGAVFAQAAGSAPASAPASDGPVWVVAKSGDIEWREYYADDEIVALLAGLLKDGDPTVREQAVRALGQTHNLTALQHLQRAAQDADVRVKTAAMAAAAEFEMGDYATVLLLGLRADADKDVAAQACRSVASLRMASGKEGLIGLLDRSEPMVQIVALEALGEMKLGAPAPKLQALLKSPSSAVRVAALQNACLADKAQIQAMMEDVRSLAQKDRPGVREWALSLLGFHAPSAGLLAQGLQDEQALVRRGALRGYLHAGKGEVMKELLKDPSPLVRLAAIRFAGQLQCQDAIGDLFGQFQEAEDDLAHKAARESLRQIGGAQVAQGAAAMADAMYKRILDEEGAKLDVAKTVGVGNEKVLQLDAKVKDAQKAVADGEKAVQALSDAKTAERKQELERAKAQAAANQDATARHRTQEKAIRNLRSCHWLLGQLKSPEGFDLRMRLIQAGASAKPGNRIQVDTPFLEEAAASLGLLGDARAAGPLNDLMAAIGKHAPGLSMMNPPPGHRYNTDVCVATMTALSRLKSPQRLADIKAILDVKQMGAGRRNYEAEVIMRILPPLLTAESRPTVEQMIGGVIPPGGMYTLRVRFEAIRSAVRIGLKSQAPAIRKVLVDERQDRNSMRMAAWALRQLTGETLPIGEPQVLQGDWILRKRP